MKKSLLQIAALVLITVSFSSCATVFGGQVSECQKTAPTAGKPARALRTGALIADVVLFWPGAVVDFATGAIYKPCQTK